MKPLVSQLWPQFMADPDFAACFGQVIVEHARMLRQDRQVEDFSLGTAGHGGLQQSAESGGVGAPMGPLWGHRHGDAIARWKPQQNQAVARAPRKMNRRHEGACRRIACGAGHSAAATFGAGGFW